MAWKEGKEGAVGKCKIREGRAEPSREQAAGVGEGTDHAVQSWVLKRSFLEGAGVEGMRPVRGNYRSHC